MKKLLLAPLLALCLTGCAALFPGISTANTVADVTAFVQDAQFADGLVTSAWVIAYPLVPPANQPAALAAYTKAQAAYTAAIQVTEDALAAYVAGTASSPNWAAVIADVQAAVDAVITVIRSFGGTVGSPSVRFRMSTPALVDQLAAVEAAQATLHRFH